MCGPTLHAGTVLEKEAGCGTLVLCPTPVFSLSPKAGCPDQGRALAAAAGACSGELLTTILLYPLELVKCRLQSSLRGTSTAGSFAYDGVVDGLVAICRQEGIRGLFIGIESVLLRALASDFATVYFGEVLRIWYRRISSRELGTFSTVMLRMLGGWGSILLTLPLEAIATRVTCTNPPISFLAAARTLYREGGLRSLWTGLRVSLLLCLNPALMLTAVDLLRNVVLRIRATNRLRSPHTPSEEPRISVPESLLVGAVAKIVTMTAIYPLVRGKVLLQARDFGGAGILQVLALVVRQEGLLSLYEGLKAQLGKSIFSAAIKYAVKEHSEGPWRRWLVANGSTVAPLMAGPRVVEDSAAGHPCAMAGA